MRVEMVPKKGSAQEEAHPAASLPTIHGQASLHRKLDILQCVIAAVSIPVLHLNAQMLHAHACHFDLLEHADSARQGGANGRELPNWRCWAARYRCQRCGGLVTLQYATDDLSGDRRAQATAMGSLESAAAGAEALPDP